MQFGRKADIVVLQSGVLRSVAAGEEKIRKLPSFRKINWDALPGHFLPKTVDMFSQPGCVLLVNADEAQLQADYKAIGDLSRRGLFDLTFVCPQPPHMGAVVIVSVVITL